MSNILEISLLNNEELSNIKSIIRTIEDPRKRLGLHPFESIMLIMICAMLSGVNNALSMEKYGLNNIGILKKLMDLPFGIPSHDTFNRMLEKIHFKEMEKILEIVNKGKILINNKESDNDIDEAIKKHVIMDAKTLRALNRENLVRAYYSKSKITLKQMKVDKDTNEISTFPNVLDELKEEIKGSIISTDAIGTQTKIVKKVIIDLKSNYLFPLKKNQHQTYSDVESYLKDISNNTMPEAEFTYHETLDKGHGRIEKRRCWTTNKIDWLYKKHRWKGLKTISLIETTTTIKDKTTITFRYYISSLNCHAKIILALARNHWSIENQLHWPLNVAFREHISTTRTGYGSQNIAILRCLSLSLLQNNGANLSINNKRATAASNFEYLLEILLQKNIDLRSNLKKTIDYIADGIIKTIYILYYLLFAAA